MRASTGSRSIGRAPAVASTHSRTSVAGLISRFGTTTGGWLTFDLSGSLSGGKGFPIHCENFSTWGEFQG